MKMINIYVLLVLVMVKFSVNALAENKNNNIEVKLKTFSNKNTFEKEDVIPIWLEIKNKSSKSYYILDSDLGVINFFSVLNSQGQKVFYSNQMQRKLNPYSVMFLVRRPIKIEIPPGKLKKIEVTPNLRKFVKFQKTGEYIFSSTIFLYHREKKDLIVDVKRVPPFKFNLKQNKQFFQKETSSHLNKLINIPFEQKRPVFGLIIKQIRISQNVFDEKLNDNKIMEVLVDIQNVSNDKFPVVQWFGRFDMVLWDSKVFHNQKMLQDGLYDNFYHILNFNAVKYNFCYDTINPGESRSFKMLIDLRCLPLDDSENGQFSDDNGSWDFIFSRKIFFNKKNNDKTIEQHENAGDVKKLVLPKISIRLKNYQKVSIAPLPIKLRENN